ncbi:hypothetical protein GQ600_2180 [Phytophthora cactorum]|nr:hypothetical protein GQ600_2180 [Phytophthora cactorum]
MSEIPGVRKHVNSQASGETKRRRIARGASSNSQPTDNALSSSLGGIVDLKRAWSKLRKEGWTSRLPRLGLDNRYIRPGENPKGIEGVDFLVGEEAVLQFISSRADKTVGAITLGTPEYSNDTCIRVATNDVCVRCDLTAAVDADAGGRGSGGRGRGAARRVQGCDQDRGVVRELGAVFGSIEVASLNTARTAQSNDSSSNDSIGLERASSTLLRNAATCGGNIAASKPAVIRSVVMVNAQDGASEAERVSSEMVTDNDFSMDAGGGVPQRKGVSDDERSRGCAELWRAEQVEDSCDGVTLDGGHQREDRHDDAGLDDQEVVCAGPHEDGVAGAEATEHAEAL